MSGLPVVLDVADRRCIVIGAGIGGRRKIAAILAAGATVTVIDPAAGPGSVNPTGDGADGVDPAVVRIEARPWRSGDTDGAFLVVIATDDPAVNEAAAAEARADGALVLRADRPPAGDLRLPAVERVAGLTVAVDSGGASPAVAAVARTELTTALRAEGDRWDELGRWAAARRPVAAADVAARLAEMRGLS
ncbi:MAG: NAD(P)-dependent oxidoreductase [Actinomycetota bacterium]